MPANRHHQTTTARDRRTGRARTGHSESRAVQNPVRTWGLAVTAAFFLAHATTCPLTSTRAFAQDQFTPPVIVLKGRVGADQHTLPPLVIRRGIIDVPAESAALPAGSDVIDASQLSVDPAFFDAGNGNFLTAPALPPEPADPEVILDRHPPTGMLPNHHRGLRPDFQTASLFQPQSEAWLNWRQAGVGLVHLLPAKQILAGQSAVGDLSARATRGSIRSESALLCFDLGPPGGADYPSTTMGVLAHLRQAFLDARRWHLAQSRGPEAGGFNLVWHNLIAQTSAGRRALFFVSGRDDVVRALGFAAEHNLAPVLFGGSNIADAQAEIVAAGADVLLTLDFGEEPKVVPPTTETYLKFDRKPPVRVQEDERARWQHRVRAAQRLSTAGVRVGLASAGQSNPSDYLAALRKLVVQGLAPADALRMASENPGRILGVAPTTARLAAGEPGNVMIWSGSWHEDSSKLRYLIVGGTRWEFNKTTTPAPTTPDTPVANLTGEWQFTIDAAEGATAAVVELSQSGSTVTGNFQSHEATGTIASGTFEKGELKFTASIGVGDRSVQLKFTGRLADDRFTGELKTAFGAAAKWTALRTNDVPADALSPSIGPAGAQLGGIEPVDEKNGPETYSVSAPDSAEPTELRRDRLGSPVHSGNLLLIENGTVLTGTGLTLSGTSILCENGRIISIGPSTAITAPAETPRVDARGQFVMPGIVDTHNHMMLSQVNEATHSITCEVRMQDVLRTDDIEEYRWLAGGLTTARLLHGSANSIGGQHAIVKLRLGQDATAHLVNGAPLGVKFALGENVKRMGGRFPNTRLGVEATLSRAFFDALAYRQKWQRYEAAKVAAEATKPSNPGDFAEPLPPRRDLRLETLVKILEHQALIHAHCYRSDEIQMLLRVADQHGLKVASLQHVLEGYKLAPEIARHGASCSTFADLWAYKLEAFDATPENAAILNAAGASVCIKSDHPVVPSYLNREAAKCVRYGNVAIDDALKFITLNPARELGLDPRLGTIEIGKEADFAIFNGHPLDGFARCEMTVIGGEVMFRRNRQPSAMSPTAAEASRVPPPLSPAPPESRATAIAWPEAPAGKYALIGARICPVSGVEIESGTILVSGGKIVAVGAHLDVPPDYVHVSLTGLRVYPGFIDAGTTLGLTEIGAVAVSNDYSESGRFQPDLRAGIALNPDSELLPVALAGGITTALVRPTGGTISGQASVIQTVGWTAADMTLELSAGLQLQWPGAENATAIADLKETFRTARLYMEARKAAAASTAATSGVVDIDPRWEAMIPFLEGTRPVLIEANSRGQIVQAFEFAEAERLRLILTGGLDAWRLADELARRKIPVLLGPVNRRPQNEYDPFDTCYAAPGRLFEAGVKFGFRSNDASASRNVPLDAGLAVAYGLPIEAALKAITLWPAEILGLESQLGSIESGKIANLVILDDYPLRATSQIQAVMLGGKPQSLGTRQTRLASKYRERLRIVAP